MRGFRPAQRTVWPGLEPFLFSIALFVFLLSGPVMMALACEDSATSDSSIIESQTAPAEWKQLKDTTIGFSLHYPGGWSDAGQVVATQFAQEASCRSVRFIDFEPPPDSGAAAPMEQSYVQVCAKPLEIDDSLDQYMQRVYGELLNQKFVKADLNGSSTYQAKVQGHAQTIFAESRSGLVQIVTFVTALPEKFPERQAQVEMILSSLKLI